MAIVMISLGLSLIFNGHAVDLQHVNVEEITSLGLKCDRKTYSCAANQSPLTCKCDPDCVIYGDCCFDSPHWKNVNLTRRNVIECMSYFIANKCPLDWKDEKIRNYCEIGTPVPTNINEMIARASVINARSGICYKNPYCANCNKDIEYLKVLPIAIVCHSKTVKKITLDKLRYDQRHSKWGFWENSNKNLSFIPCNIMGLPTAEDVKPKPRSCIPAIGKCPPGWRDRSVSEKCESYQAVVHTANRQFSYRNVHCAVCNHGNLKEAICDGGVGIGGPLGDPNFAKIFKFSPSGYERSPCQRDQLYDPFLNKCHDQICLPFQQIRNRKCD